MGRNWGAKRGWGGNGGQQGLGGQWEGSGGCQSHSDTLCVPRGHLVTPPPVPVSLYPPPVTHRPGGGSPHRAALPPLPL